jgi:TolB protein
MGRALTIAALALLGAIPSAGAEAPSAGRDIVFVSDRRGADNLYVVETDGGAPRELTAGDAAINVPDVSPDGKHVAFVRGEEGEPAGIWTATIRGERPRRVARGPLGDADLDPAWSPDGRRLAFVRQDVDGRNSVYVVDRRGGAPRLVTRRRALKSPSWSPDGRQLALADESA